MGFFSRSNKQLAQEEAMIQNIQRKQIANEGLRYDIAQQQIFDSMGERENADLVGITLDSTNIIKDIENQLRGRVHIGYDVETGRPRYAQITSPVMNEIGINAILQEIVSRVNKVGTMGAISQEEKNKIMFVIHKQITLLLASNHKTFGVEKTRRSNVVWQISNLIFLNLSRAVGGIERRELYGRHRAIEHLQRTEHGNPANKTPIFGGFN